ncbi:MAG TPA: hypothetical protein VH599_10760 [Ktedonobacterales bacterium]|jgi:hypothetical protein
MNDRAIRILDAFSQFPFLTAEQVIALQIYGPGSYQKVRAILKHFVDLEYLLRDTPLSDKPVGGVAYVYWLATRGRSVLESVMHFCADSLFTKLCSNHVKLRSIAVSPDVNCLRKSA